MALGHILLSGRMAGRGEHITADNEGWRSVLITFYCCCFYPYSCSLWQLSPRPVHGGILTVHFWWLHHQFRVTLGRGGTRVSRTFRERAWTTIRDAAAVTECTLVPHFSQRHTSARGSTRHQSEHGLCSVGRSHWLPHLLRCHVTFPFKQVQIC